MSQLIFDIGANVGNFTEACLNKIPDSKIIAVEPNNFLIEHLRKRFKLNSVQILNFLVSNQTDIFVPFYENKTADTISTASTDWIYNSRFSHNSQWLPPIDKQTITIDKMISLYGIPDLIKIDVEGYELQVLRGLTRKVNKLCFEWAEEGKESIVESCSYLENLGYQDFGYILGDDYLREPTRWVSKTELLKIMNMQPERKSAWGMIWVR